MKRLAMILVLLLTIWAQGTAQETNFGVCITWDEGTAAQFNPSLFNADEWVQEIKASGAGSVVVATHHPSGLSMWNSRSNRFNVAKASPYRKDIIKQLSKACAKQGVSLSFYYVGGLSTAVSQKAELLSKYGSPASTVFDELDNHIQYAADSVPVESLVKSLARAAGKGEKLFLTISPKPNGTIPDGASKYLHSIGAWMKLNGESLSGTKAGPVGEKAWGTTTQKDNKLYIHVLENQPSIFLPVSGDGLVSVAYLSEDKDAECIIDKDGVVLTLPDFEKPDQIVVCTYEDASERGISEAGEYLKFMYENMALPDIVTYPVTFWGENVRKAVEVRERMGWDIPETEFRHFVLPLRVNNEYLDDFRTTYADTLCSRVKGMSIGEAALEINHWCHEQATYTPSDARTSAPMATMKAGLGRCGEESVLTVSALRAAGIPARQVYTPRWAHTDDNHAWVEVYVDGKWHFMGACEPEPILDLGWFNAPVSRAMLLHTKAFGQYNGPEGVISRNSAYTEINVTDNYVPVRHTTVKVIDKDGNPVEGANVTFEIYNYAEFYPVATYKTDLNGCASLMVGEGDITIWAEKDGRFAMTKTRADFTFLTLDHHIDEEYYFEMSVVPPKEKALQANPTAEQVARNSERLTYEDILRSMHAKGNQAVLDAFKAAHPGEETKCDAILASLSKKDLNDVSLEVLEDAFAHAGAVFNPLTDAPRIENEYLYPYFAEIGQGLNMRTAFEVRVWVDNNIKVDDSLNPQGLRIPPVHVWRSRVADSKSRDIFYVALCRAKGIPAQLDELTGKTSHPSDMASKGTMTVEYTPSKYVKDPEYYRHFSISKIENGAPKLLSFNEDVTNTAGSIFPLKLDPGYYMMTSGTRMADGSVLSHVEFFNIKTNETSEVPLVVRDPGNQVSVLGSFYADPFIPVTGRGYFAFAIMGDKDEPTVHAVRQFKSIANDLNKWGRKILVYGKNKPTGLKNAVTYPYSEEVFKTLTEAVKSESTRLPVIAVADSFGRIVYFSQGYNTSLGVDLKSVINQL